MSRPALPVALVAAAAGGVIGSLARYGLTTWSPVGTGFPWTVFWINVIGCAMLAAVPALPAVRRTPVVGVFLGTGVLGGFTTMSAASAETVSLFEAHHTATGVAYSGGTLVAALAAAWLVSRVVDPAARAAAEQDEVDL